MTVYDHERDRLMPGETLHFTNCKRPADHDGECSSVPARDLAVRGMVDALTEAQRIEHSFSVAARHDAAVRRVEQVLYPAIEAATEALALALTSSDPDNLIVGLRRFASIGELVRFEAEKLEGRA